MGATSDERHLHGVPICGKREALQCIEKMREKQSRKMEEVLKVRLGEEYARLEGRQGCGANCKLSPAPDALRRMHDAAVHLVRSV